MKSVNVFFWSCSSCCLLVLLTQCVLRECRYWVCPPWACLRFLNCASCWSVIALHCMTSFAGRNPPDEGMGLNSAGGLQRWRGCARIIVWTIGRLLPSTVEKEDHGVMKMLAAVALRFFLLTKLYKRSNPFCETIRNAYQLSPWLVFSSEKKYFLSPYQTSWHTDNVFGTWLLSPSQKYYLFWFFWYITCTMYIDI